MAEKPEDLATDINVTEQLPITFKKGRVFEECELGNLKYVFSFLKLAQDVNIQNDSSQSTLLHVCARNGYTSIAAKILELNNVDLTVRDSNGDSCLHTATRYGYPTIVGDILATGISANLTNLAQETPLHLAAMHGHTNCLEVLLRNNASINIKNARNQSVLECAMHNKRVKFVEKLLWCMDSVLNGNQTCAMTILHVTIRLGMLDCLKFFLQNKYPIDTKGEGGITVLQLAITMNYVEAVQYLLSHGASCEEQIDFIEQNALHIAVKEKKTNLVRMMLPYCKDVNVRSLEGTALHIAARQNSKDIIGLLVKYGANLEIPDILTNSQTPLYEAALNNSLDCFLFLTRAGANNMAKPVKQSADTALNCYYAKHPQEVTEQLLANKDLIYYSTFRRAMFDVVRLHNDEKLADCALSRQNLHIILTLYPEEFNTLLEVLCSSENHFATSNIIKFWNSEPNRDESVIKAKTWSESMLSNAVFNSSTEYLKFLIQFPVILNHKLSMKRTEGKDALDDAIKLNQTDKVEALLQAGVKLKTQAGVYLKRLENSEFNETNKLLFEHRLSVNKTIQPCKVTPLQLSIIFDNREMLEYFLSNSACVDTKSTYGFTPLHDAVWSRNTENVVRILSVSQAKLNARLDHSGLMYNLDGSTPLHLAVRAGHMPIINLLLVYGAQVRMFDRYGRTPLDIAILNKNCQAIINLISAGADIRDVTEDSLSKNDSVFSQGEVGKNAFEILQRCGYRFRVGDQNESDSDTDTETDTDTNANIAPMYDVPTLHDLCAMSIRGLLSPNTWTSVDKLDMIPKIIRDFIILENMKKISMDNPNNQIKVSRIKVTHRNVRLNSSDPILRV